VTPDPTSPVRGASGNTVLGASLLARVPQGMAPLSLLLLVQQRTGSVAAAGLAAGAWSLGAAAGPPLWSRPAGRGRADRIVAAVGLSQAVMLIVLALYGGDSAGLWALGATAGGLLTAPASPVARTLWPRLGRDAAHVERLYTLDATAQELVFVAGPALVGLLVAVASPSASLAVAAVIGGIGAVVFSRIIAPLWVPHPHTAQREPLGRRLWIPWTSLFTLCLGLGVTEVGVPATALLDGHRAAAGPILAIWSLGSLVGGLASSRRAWGASAAHRARTLFLLLLAAAGIVWAAWPLGLGWLTVALFVAGLPLAPTLAALYALIAEVSAEARRTEAFALGNTSVLLGLGLGNAFGGWLSKSDPRHAFAATTCLLLVAAVPTQLYLARSTRRSSQTGASDS
jgi:MFS family permease